MINRERVLADLGTVEFLFPFEAAAQIFEQYMRYYQTVYQVPEWYLEQGEGVGMAEAGGSPRLYLEVTKVRFLYELRYDDWNEETLDRGNGRGRNRGLPPKCPFRSRRRQKRSTAPWTARALPGWTSS